MLFITSDHAGFQQKKKLKNILDTLQISYEDLSPVYKKFDDYPKIAAILAKKLSEEDFGIAFCGSGRGICMALNRFPHIRASYVENAQDTALTRLDNNANVVCLSGGYSSFSPDSLDMIEIIETFLNTLPSEKPRHKRRINQLSYKK